MAKEHHPYERLRHVEPAHLQVDARIFDAHTFVNTADRSLLRANIHHARNTRTRTKRSRNALLLQTHLSEAEISNQNVQQHDHISTVIQIRNHENAPIIDQLAQTRDPQLRPQRLLNDLRHIVVYLMPVRIVLFIEGAVPYRPEEFVSGLRVLGYSQGFGSGDELARGLRVDLCPLYLVHVVVLRNDLGLGSPVVVGD